MLPSFSHNLFQLSLIFAKLSQDELARIVQVGAILCRLWKKDERTRIGFASPREQCDVSVYLTARIFRNETDIAAVLPHASFLSAPNLRCKQSACTTFNLVSLNIDSISSVSPTAILSACPANPNLEVIFIRFKLEHGAYEETSADSTKLYFDPFMACKALRSIGLHFKNKCLFKKELLNICA